MISSWRETEALISLNYYCFIICFNNLVYVSVHIMNCGSSFKWHLIYFEVLDRKIIKSSFMQLQFAAHSME